MATPAPAATRPATPPVPRPRETDTTQPRFQVLDFATSAANPLAGGPVSLTKQLAMHEMLTLTQIVVTVANVDARFVQLQVTDDSRQTPIFSEPINLGFFASDLPSRNAALPALYHFPRGAPIRVELTPAPGAPALDPNAQATVQLVGYLRPMDPPTPRQPDLFAYVLSVRDVVTPAPGVALQRSIQTTRGGAFLAHQVCAMFRTPDTTGFVGTNRRVNVLVGGQRRPLLGAPLPLGYLARPVQAQLGLFHPFMVAQGDNLDIDYFSDEAAGSNIYGQVVLFGQRIYS